MAKRQIITEGRDFRGQISNAHAAFLPPGAAQLQVNCDTSRPGALSVRKGIRRMTFTGGSTAEASQVIALYRYETPTGREIIVYELANGDLCADDVLTTVGDSTANLGAPEISSSLNTARRLCFQRTRTGDLIAVNGIDYPIRWDGITSTTEKAGLAAPTVAPSISQQAGGAQTAGTYTFAYRYVDDTQPTRVASSFSPTVTSVATSTQKPNWTITTPTEDRASHIELWRTTADDTLTFYFIARIADGVTTYTTDTSSDATLRASSAANTLFSENADGSPDASRFTPPPNFLFGCALFQDRMVYFGNTKYSTGTVATGGNTTLTFTGAAITEAMENRYIEIAGETSLRLITDVNVGAQTATIDAAAGTSSSGLAYIIMGDPTYNRKLRYSERDEPESVPTTNTITLQENTGDCDNITGGHQYGASFYVTTDRHKYAVKWAEQPILDGSAPLLDDRGACNQWCWDVYENTAYAMDDAGPYAFSPEGGSQPIGDAIQDLWTNTSGDRVDLSKKDKFYVQADRTNEQVHFFVIFTGDSSTYPQRRLTLNIRTGTWDVQKYVQEIGAACFTMQSGKTRVLIGGPSEQLYLMDEGTTDGCAAHTRGSPTSSSGTTLTDSGASFGAGLVGASVAIIDGTGKGQWRRITARSSTQLTVATWDTTPDTTSVYLVGAIEYTWRSKRFEFVPIDEQNPRKARITFLPTSGDFWADLRLYLNNSTSAETFETSQRLGDGVLIDETNKTDAKIKMQQALSALENSSGFEQFDFSGRLADFAHTDRWIAVELRGYQGDDVVEFYAIDVGGVK